jgi:hypothetical protein
MVHYGKHKTVVASKWCGPCGFTTLCAIVPLFQFALSILVSTSS